MVQRAFIRNGYHAEEGREPRVVEIRWGKEVREGWGLGREVMYDSYQCLLRCEVWEVLFY